MNAMKLTVPLAVKKIFSLSHKILATIHVIIHALNNFGLIVTQSVMP
jgi:hypothetical protein